jgi:hypothetical protein
MRYLPGMLDAHVLAQDQIAQSTRSQLAASARASAGGGYAVPTPLVDKIAPTGVGYVLYTR